MLLPTACCPLPTFNRELGPDDRFQSRLPRRLIEPRRTVHAIGIEQCQGWIPESGRALHERFGESLATADRVVVTDIYGARESPIPGVTGRLVADAAVEAGANVEYVAHLADLASYLAGQVQPGDLVLTMGAGDITTVPAELAALLIGEGTPDA